MLSFNCGKCVCVHNLAHYKKDENDTDHFQQLVALIQMCHNDSLAFGNRTVYANKLAVFSEGIDLMQHELILFTKRGVSITFITHVRELQEKKPSLSPRKPDDDVRDKDLGH
jgi:hypothetical protein